MAIRYSKFLPLATFISDLILLNIALQCAHSLVFKYYSSQIESANFILLVNLVWISISTVTKNYIIYRPLVLRDNLNRFLSSLLYHLLVVLGIIYFFRLYEVSRWEMFFTYSLFFFLIIIQRSVIFFILDYIRKKGYNRRHVLVIGDQNIANRLIKSFSKHPEYGYYFTDFISEGMIKDFPEQVLMEKLISKNPDEIFVCYKYLQPSLLQKLVDFGDQNAIKIKLVSDLVLNNNYASIVNYENLPVIHLSSNPGLSLKVIFFKRSFDILFSLSVMIVGSPIFILLMLLTKFTSKGPAFYKQVRIGKNHRPFTIYKFRSMYVNAEAAGPQLSSETDPRITAWGKILRRSRMDELPQFWNVLKGEMSVVGPRPERQYFIEQLIEKSPSYKKLLRIKPGLTSIGQVSYGYAENIDQMHSRLRYDLIYLNNINFNSDMGIILKTIRVMVQLKGK
ncbi:sugar transferase [Mucilaginibacter lappiensis]|jgi:exopolysaccharide biosynthesis polyprenyl glycosylphosphotransferase|uniref:sugar transferase n=1 Tax=Mucilaginibacter lappiensis TaxID=354630 RepID=UPI003D24C8EB